MSQNKQKWILAVISVICFANVRLSADTLSAAEARLEFGAYYTQMNQGQVWENFSRTGKYADVVVQLPEGKLFFWRGQQLSSLLADGQRALELS
jgi:hypothetical protein